jgi:hypothetical protein
VVCGYHQSKYFEQWYREYASGYDDFVTGEFTYRSASIVGNSVENDEVDSSEVELDENYQPLSLRINTLLISGLRELLSDLSQI